jgi:2-polyprenyl-3-methyl-5-hydroxy-6-metoxy-1,4-benzoquinol methylase
MDDEGRKTTHQYWNDLWRSRVRMCLPSGLFVGTKNLKTLIKSRIRPGMRLLEIGCSHGKMLSWASAELGVKTAGLDYSENGIRTARALFDHLGLEADFRCEDVFSTTFEQGSFDLVCSFGLIEHFDDPTEVVRRHLLFAKPGGRALIAIPNYGGIYGRLQRWFDPGNLGMHNLDIMDCRVLARLVPGDLAEEIRSFPAGRLSPWLISFENKWSRGMSNIVCHFFNVLGLIQPVDIEGLCPLLVLEMTRKKEQA